MPDVAGVQAEFAAGDAAQAPSQEFEVPTFTPTLYRVSK
jgi:hypothetical protein